MKNAGEFVYSSEDLDGMSSASNYHHWILKNFSAYLGLSVLEIGAGCGNISRLLMESFDLARLVSIEPSKNVYLSLERCMAQFDAAITVNGYLADHVADYEAQFDSIMYNNVLEHVEDDVAELVIAGRTLKPGGHLLIFVPALSWLYSKHDKDVGHFRRYHKEGLVSVVESAGFSVKTVKYFDVAGVLPWYILCVMMKRSVKGGGVSLYDKAVVPVMSRVESIFAPPFGKNLLLIAQKK